MVPPSIQRALWFGFVPWTAVILLCVAASVFPKFPGDLQISVGLQRLFGEHHGWAEWVTNTAKSPGRWFLLALSVGWTVALVRGRTRWILSLFAVVCFFLMLAVDGALKPLIGRPRPSSDLVEVVGSSAGYSCPSTFGLIQAGTIGWMLLLAALRLRGGTRTLVLVLGLLWLLVGAAARIVLGGHWASDMGVAYAVGGWIAWRLLCWGHGTPAGPLRDSNTGNAQA